MTDTPVTRRSFVQTTTGAVAAGIVLPATAMTRSADEPIRAPRAIKKAVKYYMVEGDLTLREKFQRLVDLGYDGIELDSPNDLDDDEVLAARDATGIAIHGVVCSAHWKHPLSHPDAAERGVCRAAMEVALADSKRYGGTSVLLVPGVVNKSVAYADAYRRSQEEIRRLVPMATDLGIDIAFENVWNNFLLSPVEAARYVDEFESERIGWYFDVGNIVRSGWPEHWIHALGKRIMKLDIKEYSRKKRDNEGLWKGFDVELLEGDCDWPAVMKALDAIGFTGWATAEIGGGDENRLRDVADRMDKILVS